MSTPSMPKRSINTAIAAMLNDIDPYTEYYPASEQEDLAMMTSGEYGGHRRRDYRDTRRGYSYPSPTRGTAIAEKQG